MAVAKTGLSVGGLLLFGTITSLFAKIGQLSESVFKETPNSALKLRLRPERLTFDAFSRQTI